MVSAEMEAVAQLNGLDLRLAPQRSDFGDQGPRSHQNHQNHHRYEMLICRVTNERERRKLIVLIGID